MEYSNTFGGFNFLAPLFYIFDPHQRIYLPYLMASFVIAIVLFGIEHLRVDRSKRAADLFAHVFPAAVYKHSSAKVDYLFFFVNAILYTVILAPFAFLFTVCSGSTQELLHRGFGHPAQPGESTFAWSLTYTFIVIVAFDLGLYLAHYLFHRVPVLWQFHKVHHSAQVMTPITVYRMHPVDDIATISFTASIGGIVDGLFRYNVMPNINLLTVEGVNLFLFIFYIVAYHLRHSHIWFSYGTTLSHLFISPAQHQIHHSKAQKHWDKNFGFMFSWWDWFFGSLYVPREREQIEFGIGEEEKEFSSVWRLYWLPFKKAWLSLRGRL